MLFLSTEPQTLTVHTEQTELTGSVDSIESEWFVVKYIVYSNNERINREVLLFGSLSWPISRAASQNCRHCQVRLMTTERSLCVCCWQVNRFYLWCQVCNARWKCLPSRSALVLDKISLCFGYQWVQHGSDPTMKLLNIWSLGGWVLQRTILIKSH